MERAVRKSREHCLIFLKLKRAHCSDSISKDTHIIAQSSSDHSEADSFDPCDFTEFFVFDVVLLVPVAQSCQ